MIRAGRNYYQQKRPDLFNTENNLSKMHLFLYYHNFDDKIIVLQFMATK